MDRTAARRPFADVTAMRAAMAAVLEEAGEAELLALLRSHPRLADKVAQADGLSAESAKEQAGAGLDRLSPEDYAQFDVLNRAYESRFGFPFVICVRLTDRRGILAAMVQRLDNSPRAEFAAALAEVGRIVDLRLADMLAGGEVR